MQVLFELDASLVVQFIREGLDPYQPYFSIVLQCFQMFTRD